jgi:hypothetical protein
MPCLVDELLQLRRDIAKPSGRAERDAICPRESAVSAPSAGLVFVVSPVFAAALLTQRVLAFLDAVG